MPVLQLFLKEHIDDVNVQTIDPYLIVLYSRIKTHRKTPDMIQKNGFLYLEFFCQKKW